MLAELCLMAANEGTTGIATSMDDCIGIELYWNASANECLDTCESGVYKRDNTNALVKICIAEADCTSKTFADGPLKECVKQCQFFDYTLEIDGKRYCYAYSCPSAYPVVGKSGDCDTCRSVTNGELPYWFGMAKKCVSKRRQRQLSQLHGRLFSSGDVRCRDPEVCDRVPGKGVRSARPKHVRHRMRIKGVHARHRADHERNRALQKVHERKHALPY